KMADRVAVMYNGDLVECAPVEQLFTAPAHSYTQMLLAAQPKGTAASYDATTAPILSAKEVKVHFPVKAGVFHRTVDYVRAVDGIDIDIRAGQTVGVVGESGS